MFQQKTVKIFSIVAIVLSAVGLLISLVGTFVLQRAEFRFVFFIGIISLGNIIMGQHYRLSALYIL